MKNLGVIFCLVLCVAVILVECADPPKPEPKVGEPQYSLQGAGGGKDHRNFQAGFNAGVGTRVWESKKKDASLDLGVSYGQGFARQSGHTFKSEPTYGFGGTFRWGRK
ncbi:hypothetical protein NPIL_663461 [Nephila pilipes]|uniref:BLTX816 n=1 Tax=Nephila pilipes TaxID=299642 RepID=A0A076KVM2_NEPPI|nr:BLTX816 [Nephila pilipes]GFU18301.1 hypothetical protein NPIL_663461 [Nephila pilipes]